MKFIIETLGCKVNSYESNVMIDLLINNGFIEAKEGEIADIYIINTCTVTNNADHKSVKVIKQAIKKNSDAIIIVTGCLSQTNEAKINEIDGVDIIIGNVNKSKIVDYINNYIEEKEQIRDVVDICNVEFEQMNLNNFNKTRAFVKIQDGCNNYCSYCIIPYARGNIRSRQPEDILKEIHHLVENGHKEIVLTGIHTGSYGIEFKNYDLSNLLLNIIKIKGIERIRISSIEITELNEDFMEVLKNNPIIVDHMHIPLQSGSDSILKLMNRKYNVQYFIDKINKIREIRPNILITTDVIVGFPGETDEYFLETIDTINKIGFSKLHVFPYSKRNGTVAALMKNQVDNSIKKARVHELLKLSKELELKTMESYIGKQLSFLPEIEKNGYIIGHAGNYLSIKVKNKKHKLNESLNVIIKKIEYPHCIGEEYTTD